METPLVAFIPTIYNCNPLTICSVWTITW